MLVAMAIMLKVLPKMYNIICTKAKQKRENATELVFKVKYMNLLIKKSPRGSKTEHKNSHHQTI